MRNYRQLFVTLTFLSILAMTSSASSKTVIAQEDNYDTRDVDSGTYINSEFGFEVVIPDGWTASEITFDGDPIVSLNFLHESFDLGSGITLSAVDKAWSEAEAKKVLDSMTAEERALAKQYEDACKELESSTTVINGRTFDVTVVECNIQGFVTKSKIVSTEVNGILYDISYFGSSFGGPSFEFGAAALDEIAKTMKIGISDDASSSSNVGVELIAVIQSIALTSGESIDLKLESSSTVSNFALNEDRKQISFKVSSEDGTQGTTIIPISEVLEGPYTVTIDDEVTTDFETMESDGGTSIKLTYHHSTRDVTITGTQVVPEFSTIAALILAILLLTVIGFTTARRRMMPSRSSGGRFG